MLQKCAPGAVAWIEQAFGDCVYNGRDLAGFCVGLGSICCWLVAQMPQLYHNYRSQSAEALSPWFLAEWLLGDTCNLLGALLKGDQPTTVVLTAQYFIMVDAVMMVQYIYYISLQRRRERMLAERRRHRHHRHHRHSRPHAVPHHQHSSGDEAEPRAVGGSEGEGRGPRAANAAATEAATDGGHSGEIVAASSSSAPTIVVVGSGGTTVPVMSAAGRDVSFRPQRMLACLGTLLMVAHLQQGPASGQPVLEAAPDQLHRRLLVAVLGSSGDGGGGAGLLAHLPSWAYTAGTALGYTSSALYLTSRLSQIARNAARRSVEGLAISMFLCACAANSLYGASILIRSYTWAELRSSLPWLIGSLGTVALDLTIFAQWRTLGRGAAQPPKERHSDEDEPLLAGREV